MRCTIVLLAGCAATAPVPPRVVHSVTCAGVRIPVPASMRIVQAAGGKLIAASPDVALAVFEDGPTRSGGKARVIEQISDLDRPIYRMAFRDADRCTFRAVALLPASPDGVATLTAIAGTPEPSLYVGSPRAAREAALSILLREVEPHL